MSPVKWRTKMKNQLIQDAYLTMHEDGGHAWLKVSMEFFNRTNRTMRSISRYSYEDKTNYYLEEDVDATLYLQNLKDQDIKINIHYLDDGDYSPIRDLCRVSTTLTFKGFNESANDLKAWQDGTLVNTNAINKLSLKELNKINDMFTKAGY